MDSRTLSSLRSGALSADAFVATGGNVNAPITDVRRLSPHFPLPRMMCCAALSALQTAGGWTPMHFAAAVGDVKFCQVLLECGASVNTRQVRAALMTVEKRFCPGCRATLPLLCVCVCVYIFGICVCMCVCVHAAQARMLLSVCRTSRIADRNLCDCPAAP